MIKTYEPGELFVYTNGDRWELGMVKRPGSGDGYFCWYSRGDTAANTPVEHMHKLENAGFTHIEQLLDDATKKQAEWDEMLEEHNGVAEWYSPRLHPPKAIKIHFGDGIAKFVPEETTVGNAGYGIQFAPTFDRPPETMVGETVFDGEGNAIGWVTSAEVGAGTCHIKPWKMEPDTGFFDCMECDCGFVEDVSVWAKANFCPNCGKRIKEEAE